MIAVIESPVGRIWISGDRRGVFELAFSEIPGPAHNGELDWILPRLESYFSGSGTAFPGALAFEGKTPVWSRGEACPQALSMSQRALLIISKIPFGCVKTYGRIAADLGNPGLARAVGQVCRSNPIPLLVPCHRVVGKSSLVGFSSGLWRKEALLAHEGIRYPR